MAIDIRITLTDQDLDYFRQLLEEAQRAAAEAKEDEIVKNVLLLLDRIDRHDAPDFVRRRLQTLRTMTDMLSDTEWSLELQERTDIVSALAYFYGPTDAVADDVPALGLIDDAIVIELVARELRHELEAYEEFCKFREVAEQLGQRDISHDAWLREKRHDLFERMRDRMARQERTHRGAGRLTSFSLS